MRSQSQAKALGSQSQSTIPLPSCYNPAKIRKRVIPSFILLLIVYIRRQSLRLHDVGMNGKVKKNPTNDPKKKRWAVMMVGAPRSYMITRNSFLQNVVNQSDPPMDIFTLTPRISNPSCLADLESVRMLEMDSTVIHFDENYIVLEGRDIWKITEDRLVRQQNETFQMIDNYAGQKNINYDFIFYTRPDLYHTLPINIMELEEKFGNITEGINNTIFSPGCCAYSGWCDQLAAGRYQDFAKMIGVSREWASRDADIERGHPESLFKARGAFANVSSFDLHLNEDYEFSILRLYSAKAACGGHEYNAVGTDAACGSFSLNATFEQCEILNMSDICNVGSYAG